MNTIITDHAIERYFQRLENKKIKYKDAQHIMSLSFEKGTVIDQYERKSKMVTDFDMVETVEVRKCENLVMLYVKMNDTAIILTCYPFENSKYDQCKMKVA